MEERRKEPRRRILKGAIIAYNRLSSTIPCVVRNLSDHGCKLCLEGAIPVPKAFILWIELDGTEVPCMTIWRNGKELGVEFTGPVTYREQHRRQIVQSPA